MSAKWVARGRRRRSRRRRTGAHLGLMEKPAKNEIQKNNREIDRLYLCLQLFDNFLNMKLSNLITGNGSYVNLNKLVWKILWNHFNGELIYAWKKVRLRSS